MNTAPCQRPRLWALILLGLISAAAAAAERSRLAEAAKPSAAALKLLEYREPVNGLVARIEGIRHSRSNYIVVRLQNRGKTPLDVPTCNPEDPKQQSPFSLWGRNVSKWTRLPWWLGGGYGAPLSNDPIWGSVTLQPGESVLTYLIDFQNENQFDDLTELAVVLYREKAATKNGWTGKLQTPPYPIHTSDGLWGELAGQVPMPTYFPPFSRKRVEFPSGPPGGAAVLPELRNANRMHLEQLVLYRPADVARLLEKRAAEEKDAGLKRFLTVYMYAAAAGHPSSASFAMTSHGIFAREREEVLKALEEKRQRDGPNWQPTPKWVTGALLDAFQKNPTSEELASALGDLGCRESVPLLAKMLRMPKHRNCAAHALGRIDDPRSVSALLELLPAEAAEFERISADMFREDYTVIDALEELRAKEAVPPIIELAKKTGGHHGYVAMLGRLGDARAIPALIDILKAHENTRHIDDERNGFSFNVLLAALVKLRAREAVPLLLKHLDSEHCIEAVSELGDPRAIPALRKVAGTKGKNALAAKLAIAKLGEGDPTPQYVALLADETLSVNERRRVVWHLSEMRSPRAIPHLVALIKDEPDWNVTVNSIHSLAQIKDTAAVEALIHCFDFDYTQKTHEQLAMIPSSTPSDYPQVIAAALRQLTGANVGTNPAHWRKWWDEEGKKGEWLR